MGPSLMTFAFTLHTSVLHHADRLPSETSPLFSTTHSDAQLNYFLLAPLFWDGAVNKQRERRTCAHLNHRLMCREQTQFAICQSYCRE